MAYKLVTVLDDAEPIDNVLPALSMDVDEVFYLYHNDMPLKTCDAIEIVIGRYKPRMRVHFRCLKNDREEIAEILKQHPDAIIDVGGAKYLSLVLFEMVLNRDNLVIYYDNQENRIKSYRTHTVIVEDVFRLSIRDCLNLGGGEILRHLHSSTSINDERTINAVKGIVNDTFDNYNQFISFVNRINKLCPSNGSLHHHLMNAELEDIERNPMYELCIRNNLFRVENNELTFLNRQVMEMFGVSGSFLENYLYIVLKQSGLFDEVLMSVVIDFSTRRDNRIQIICEIDALVIRNNHLVFVSCKSNKADTGAINEIKLHSLMFGNALSSACLCTLDDLNVKSPSVYAKAKELEVAIIDQTSFLRECLVEEFVSIMNKSYQYERLPD